MPPFTGYPDFSSAANAVLEYLRGQFGFQLWMVTRTEGEDWIVLESNDHGYGVSRGDVFKWADSFCSRMVMGQGPCIAPNSNAVESYSEAPIGQQVPIGAYIGVPLKDSDGGLFGTLCAIDPEPQEATLVDDLPLIQLLSQLLSSYLVAELQLSASQRTSQLMSLESLADPITGGLSTEGWHRVIAAEESRCCRYGFPAAVIAIHFPDASDVERISNILRDATADDESRHFDGDQLFLFLLPETGAGGALQKMNSIKQRLADQSIAVNIAFAVRDPREDLASTIEGAIARACPAP